MLFEFSALTIVLFISLADCRRITIRTGLATLAGYRDYDFGADVFTGIPFAQPPTGSRRLQPPVAITSHQGEVNVMGPPVACMQPKTLPFNSSEDCLTLDIVRPSQDNKQNALPVYIFIHGGSFVFGDKAGYDGRNLVNSSVKFGAPFIFVAMNYRLGFLGFPSGSEAAANNALNLGLLDQRMAIQWVKDNIAAFGGDPNKVVIGGQEVGGNAVAFHMLAYNGQSNGLFRGGILQSGSAIAATPIPPPTYKKWQDEYNNIVLATGCAATTVSSSFNCLQKVNIGALNGAIYRNFVNVSNLDPAQIFGPVIDGKFLRQNVSLALAERKFTAIPTLMGRTTDELIEMVPQASGLGSDADLHNYGRQSLPFASESFLQQLRTYYPVSQYQNVGPPLAGSQWSRAVAIVNDLRQFCPLQFQGYEFSKVASTWKYRWNAVIQSKHVEPWFGVPQGSELDYLFPVNGENMASQSSVDLTLMSAFQRSIISFVNFLDPNTLQAARSSFPLWKNSSPNTPFQMVFQRPDSNGTGIFIEKDPKNGAMTPVCQFIIDNSNELLR